MQKNYESVFKFSDGKVYVVADDSNVFRIDGNKVDETFEPVMVNNKLKNADSMFYDKENKRVIVFKGKKIFAASGSDIKKISKLKN